MKTITLCLKLVTLLSAMLYAPAWAQHGEHMDKDMIIIEQMQERQLLLEDIVHKLVPSDQGQKVMFRQHAAVYYLKQSNLSYATILEALKKHEANKEPAKLLVDSVTMEILEYVL